MSRLDTIVIGAGPTGLTCGLYLQQKGHKVKIIDQKSTTTDESRGMIIHARTLELLEVFGCDFVEEFINAGRKLYQSNTISGQKILAKAILTSRVDTKYNFALIISQADSERILHKKLKSLGGNVDWNCKVNKITENPDSVDVQLNYLDTNSIVETTASWLIGCDGAHSLVRHSCGIQFEGSPYLMNLWATDLNITGTDLPGDIEHQSFGFISEIHGALVIPLAKPGMFRIIVAENSGKKVSGSSENRPTIHQDIDFYKNILKFHYPSSVNWNFHEPIWNNHFRIHCRIASHFRSPKHGRCFLAGDSAHLYSPVGGQGMNMGIHDAINLSWKLSQVLSFFSPVSILDSYELERKKVTKATLLAADLMTKLVGTRNSMLIFIRNNILFPIASNAFIQNRIVGSFQGLLYYYPLHKNNQTLAQYLPNPLQKYSLNFITGSRLPNPSILLDENSKRLFDLFPMGSATLLFFTFSNNHYLPKLIDEITEQFNNIFKICIISPMKVLNISDEKVKIINDKNGIISNAFHVNSDSCYFIRPDGHIGFCSSPIEVSRLSEYLTNNYTANTKSVKLTVPSTGAYEKLYSFMSHFLNKYLFLVIVLFSICVIIK